MPSTEMTVGDLIDRLSGCDRNAPVRLAINPFFPMAHRLDDVVQTRTVQTAVYLAEGRDADTQMGHLPPEVSTALTWQPAGQPPPRRPRRPARG